MEQELQLSRWAEALDAIPAREEPALKGLGSSKIPDLSGVGLSECGVAWNLVVGSFGKLPEAYVEVLDNEGLYTLKI